LANRCNRKSRPTRFFTFKLLSHNYLDVKPNLQISSDHTAIIATIGTHIITRQQPPKLHNSKTSWETFRNKIEGNFGLNIPLRTAEEMEEASTQFNKVIKKAAWSVTPDDKTQAKHP
jgi:hypothetical protein